MWWASTLASFQSTVLFFPDEQIPSLVPLLFGASLAASVLSHFTIALVLVNGESRLALLMKMPWLGGVLVGLGMASITIGSYVGSTTNAAIAFVLAGAVFTGMGNAWFDSVWGQLYGRLDPRQSSFWILASVLLAVILYFAIAWLSSIEPRLGPPLCLTVVAAGSIVLGRAVRAQHERFEGSPHDHEGKTRLVPQPSAIIKTLWKPVLGCSVFAFVFSLSEQYATIGAAAIDFNSVHTFSLVGNALGAAFLLLLMFGFGKQLDASTVGKISIPLLVVGFLILPAMLDVATIGANALISTGCAVFDMMLACLLAETAFDYRASGAVLVGFTRGVTIGSSGIGALFGWAFATAFPYSTLSLVIIAVGVCYLIVFTGSIVMSRKKVPNEAILDEIVPEKEPHDEEKLERSAQELVERKTSLIASNHGLTRRETEVLEYLVKGRSLVYISDELVLSQHTVRSHVRHIYEKTGVHSKQELLDLFEAS